MEYRRFAVPPVRVCLASLSSLRPTSVVVVCRSDETNTEQRMLVRGIPIETKPFGAVPINPVTPAC